jgi:hypothetical protein
MSRPLRRGDWTPSLCTESFSQNQDFQAATPRMAKAEKLTKVRRVICCWVVSWSLCPAAFERAVRKADQREGRRAVAVASGGMGSVGSPEGGVGSGGGGGAGGIGGVGGGVSVMGFVFGVAKDFEAGYHGLKIIPAGEDDLHHMYEEEQAIDQGKNKMDDAGAGIAAEEKSDPVELDGFVDRQPGEDGTEAHDDDTGIGDLLGGVEFSLGRRGLAEMQIVQQDEPGFFKGMAVGEKITPFAAKECVEYIGESVYKKKPHKDEMKGHAFGQSGAEVECFVKGIWEKGEDNGVAEVDLVYIVCPVDEHSAPDHDEQDREVDPMHPADGQGMLGN